LIHTAAYWLMLTLRGLAPRRSFWREAQFDTIRLCLIKVAARVTEIVTRIRIALPTAYPYQLGFAMLAGRIVKLPP
jgi:Transposase DDE domain group 1